MDFIEFFLNGIQNKLTILCNREDVKLATNERSMLENFIRGWC